MAQQTGSQQETVADALAATSVQAVEDAGARSPYFC
jgi:hypothetical protein